MALIIEICQILINVQVKIQGCPPVVLCLCIWQSGSGFSQWIWIQWNLSSVYFWSNCNLLLNVDLIVLIIDNVLTASTLP